MVCLFRSPVLAREVSEVRGVQLQVGPDLLHPKLAALLQDGLREVSLSVLRSNKSWMAQASLQFGVKSYIRKEWKLLTSNLTHFKVFYHYTWKSSLLNYFWHAKSRFHFTKNAFSLFWILFFQKFKEVIQKFVHFWALFHTFCWTLSGLNC